MQTKACVSFKLAPEDSDAKGTFEAIVSAFGNVDSVNDRVVKGAFAGTLAQWKQSGAPIPVIWSHQWSDPRMHVGSVLDAEERDEGLWIKGALDIEAPADQSAAKQVYDLLKTKRVQQFSFAYDELRTKDQGDGVTDLLELELFEVGPCLVGANRATELLDVKHDGLKVGRAISAANEEKLRGAHGSIGDVLDSIDGKAGSNRRAKTGDDQLTEAIGMLASVSDGLGQLIADNPEIAKVLSGLDEAVQDVVLRLVSEVGPAAAPVLAAARERRRKGAIAPKASANGSEVMDRAAIAAELATLKEV